MNEKQQLKNILLEKSSRKGTFTLTWVKDQTFMSMASRQHSTPKAHTSVANCSMT